MHKTSAKLGSMWTLKGHMLPNLADAAVYIADAAVSDAVFIACLVVYAYLCIYSDCHFPNIMTTKMCYDSYIQQPRFPALEL